MTQRPHCQHCHINQFSNKPKRMIRQGGRDHNNSNTFYGSGSVNCSVCRRTTDTPMIIHIPIFHAPLVQNAFSIWYGVIACAKRTGTATSVARRRRERLARTARGMRASRSGTRAASQAFEHTHTHDSIWKKGGCWRTQKHYKIANSPSAALVLHTVV